MPVYERRMYLNELIEENVRAKKEMEKYNKK
jgi:hypothetical protein